MILPCPLCESTHVSVMSESVGDDRFPDMRDYIVICRNCKVSTRKEISEESALAIWNRRGKEVVRFGKACDYEHRILELEKAIGETGEEHATQGCVTTREPYAHVDSVTEQIISVDGKPVAFTNIDPGMASEISKALNDAYALGWHECSIELMNGKKG